jgi:hypothetical protein
MTARGRRGGLVLLVAAVVIAAPVRGRGEPTSLVVTQIPLGPAPAALADGTLPASWGDGGRIVLAPPAGSPRVLTKGFHSAADPDVSFDSTKILFAGKQEEGDPWCVWEMDADGSGVHRITCGPGEARHPIYVPTMYTLNPTATDTWEQIAFVGSVPGETNEVGVGPHTALYACTRDGERLRRLTYNLSSDFDPAMLPDGRLVFAAWQRHSLERGRLGRVALFSSQIDGVDLMIFSGDEGRRVKHMPASVGDRLVVFVEADRIEGDGGGRLASVSLRRNLHTYRSLSGPGDGLYHSPSRDPDGGMLVSWRPGGERHSYGVYRLEPETGERVPLVDDPGWHDVQAKALAPRPRPDDRSSSVQDADPEGGLYSIDVSISDLGPEVFPLGMARRLRVLEGLPLEEGAEAPPPLAPRRLLGEADLAPDGSFHVSVPADVPIQLQLLDEDGLALRSCGWIWVRNHEQRGCVGCHEDPERTPPNRFALALDSPPPQLTLPPERRRTVEFDRDVRPIFERRCVSCHGEGGSSPRLDTQGPAGERGGYQRLLESHVVAGQARTSPLVWHLMGRRTDRPWDGVEGEASPAPMPAEGGPLTAEEIRTVVEWIDFGASWGDETGLSGSGTGGQR